MSSNPQFVNYEKVLLSIPPAYTSQIYNVLQFLAFGNEPLFDARPMDLHPLTLVQLLEVTSIDYSTNPPCFDSDIRLSANIINETCFGLLKTEEVSRNRYGGDKETVTILRFVHDDVKTYLLSGDIRRGPAKAFAIFDAGARECIVNSCLAYLFHMPHYPKEWKDVQGFIEEYPLAYYASLWWSTFLPQGRDPEPSTQVMLDLLFLDSKLSAYNTWIHLLPDASHAYLNNRHSLKIMRLGTYTNEKRCPSCQGGKTACCFAPPIVWASAWGLETVAKELLKAKADVNEVGTAGVGALFMAIHENYYSIAELLFENGADAADAYVRGGDTFPRDDISRVPLYYAAFFGKTRFVELLLSDAKRLGRPGWQLDVALERAAEGHDDSVGCVRALLGAGLNIDALGPKGGCALHTAALAHKDGLVSFLLENGADPNVTGGQYHSALQAAGYRGGKRGIENVRNLLKFGADPNIEGGPFGTPLIVASWRETKDIVELLLEAGGSLSTEWDLSTQINGMSGLNYVTEIWDPEVKILETAGTDDERSEVEKNYEDAELLLDEDDQGPGSEHDFKSRIDARVEGQLAFHKQHGWGCMHGTARNDRYHMCSEIRRAAMRITRRIREAGVQEDEKGKLMFTPIQAAVAQERYNSVEMLVKFGAEMPAVIAVTPEKSVQDAERWAKRLRMEDFVQQDRRTVDGQYAGSGSSMLPQERKDTETDLSGSESKLCYQSR